MDIAQLGLSIDARPATTGAQELDKLTASAGRAEGATEKLTATQRAFGMATTAAFSEITTLLRAIQSSTSELATLARAHQTAASATTAHTAATSAQATATEGLAASTERASTAGVKMFSAWSNVQMTMGGATAAFSQTAASLDKLDAHVLAHQQHLAGATGALKQHDAQMQAWLAHMSGGTRVIGDADAHMVAYRDNLVRVGKNMRLTASEGLNMSRQIADIGVTAAMGMNPLMIALQQGPQLFDIMQTAAIRSGATIQAVMISTGRAAWAGLAPLLPVIAAIGVAAAAIALPFAVSAQQINAQNKGLIDGLGLTKDQLDKVKDKGVTMGDVLTGVWTATSKALTAAFGPEIKAVQEFFGDLYQGAVDGAVAALKGIVGGFTGGFAAIKATWSVLPQALGDAAYSAANIVLRGIQGMINGGVNLLNGLIDKANAAADAIPGIDAFIPSLSPVAIAQLANPFAGAMTRVGNEGGAAFSAGFERGAGRVDGFLSSISNEIEAAARRRIRREAGDAEGGASGAGAERAARAVQTVERLLPNVSRQIREISVRVPEIVNPLELVAREMALIDDLARDAGRGMADSFGRAGDALGGMLTALSGYRAELSAINLAESEFRISGAQAARQRTDAELRSYSDMTSAAKGFFGEKTLAYKALQGVEMAYAALRFANSVRSMALDTAETGSSIANSLARGAAKAAEAVADIFAKLGPWGFPVAAAAIGVMASVGLKALGGGGSSAVPTLPTTNTGTGTVLGSGGEQSESLSRSLDMMERYQDRDLEFSSRSLNALRAIQANIGSLTTAIAREMNIGGGLDPTGLNQGPTTSGGFLGAFSTTRSSELVGSGINLTGGALADLIAQGVSGGLYQIVQTTSRNSGFFGIGASTRTTNRETSTGIDQGLSQEFSRVLASLREGVLAAAGDLGLTGAEATINAFQVSLGRISFDGMSSSEISETLNAVFSAVGDDMARSILPGLDAFQRAGEGLFETLSRLATEYRTVDVTLQSIGMSFAAVGLSSVEARSRLVELAGGLDAFNEGASFFAEAFLSDAQRIAPVQAAVTAELTRLGLATDISRSGFADLVRGLDVSSEAGAAMFAALMRLAPALDQVIAYQDELAGVTTEVADAVDLSRQRRALELQLMEAQGQTVAVLAARRTDELAALDATLRPLQEQVWAALDLAEATRAATAAQEEAARAAEALAAQRRGLDIALMEATGNAAGALAARRADEIAALDASLRPIQLAIYAAQDLAQANAALAEQQSAATAAVDSARSDLTAAYEREAGVLNSTRDRFQAFADTIAEFRRSLDIDNGLNGVSYAAARAQAMQVGARAALGDEEALGGLTGSVQTYLEASKSSATTQLAYLKDLLAAKILLEKAEGTATRTASNATLQLMELQRSVEGLVTVNTSVLSVRDAITRLQIALTTQAAVGRPGATSTGLPTWAGDASASQDFGANPGFNMRLAGLTGYRGSFAGEGFEAWLAAQDEAVRAVARSAYRDFDMIPGFADGGVFRNGVVTQPTAFNMAQMGEAGPEAIMPLVNGPNGLGVRLAGNDNGRLEAAIERLTAKVASLEAAALQTAVNTGKTARSNEEMRDDLDFMVNGGGVIKTEAA